MGRPEEVWEQICPGIRGHHWAYKGHDEKGARDTGDKSAVYRGRDSRDTKDSRDKSMRNEGQDWGT
jgi:hypothetical protein